MIDNAEKVFDQTQCVHPQCRAKSQMRYDFVIPLCAEHLVQTLTASTEVIRSIRSGDASQRRTPVVPRSVTRKSRPDQVVYYLQFGNRIKIGTTANLRARLEAIPHDRLLATEPGGYALEHLLHLEFAADRITGEWFKATPRLLAHVDKVRHAHTGDARTRQA